MEKIIYLLVVLFQYSFDGAIQSKLGNVICDHLSIHKYVKKIAHWNLWIAMDI